MNAPIAPTREALRRPSWRDILGPGLITGASDDDPSGIATYSQGAVTRTEFGRTKIGKPNSDSGGGGGSPRLESFVSEDAERAAGCEMALDVEGVVDGGVNGQEALG